MTINFILMNGFLGKDILQPGVLLLHVITDNLLIFTLTSGLRLAKCVQQKLKENILEISTHASSKDFRWHVDLHNSPTSVTLSLLYYLSQGKERYKYSDIHLDILT